MRRLARLAGALLVFTAIPAAAPAQTARSVAPEGDVSGVVLDQTGLPLPGATVQLFNGPVQVTSITTKADGTFAIDAALPGDTIAVSLDGFEAVRVPRGEAARITLAIAHATDTASVVASAAASDSPAAALLGHTLTTDMIARLPSSKMKARESLPLLPSVIRGPDGLMQLGGARAYDSPLFLDGFNVTDPATGISSINLPFEAVRVVDVLRDPMAVTYGGLLAGMLKIESKTGGDKRAIGVQGVVPRPRFTRPGFGRIEGIFPRAFASGAMAKGRVHYMAATEFDFERIPVPGVTRAGGPDIVEKSATIFTRVDAQLNARHAVTFEGLAFPSKTRSIGLSPRRDETATADLNTSDLFAGVTHRFIANQASVFTVQIGVLAHDATLTPNGSGPSLLSPTGWRGNWFAAVNRSATRYSALATWERITTLAGRAHDFSMSGEVASRRLRGGVAEAPIVVGNADGQTVRTVDFGPPSTISARDRPLGLSVRDVWQASDRIQVDGGVRIDHSRHGGGTPSGRVGVRYALDQAGTTVLKGGYGSFVGNLPLAVPAFGSYPVRLDRQFDPVTGDIMRETALQPRVGRLRLPHAVAATFGIEQQLFPGLDALIAVTNRRSSRLATLHVREQSGELAVDSTGSARYREVQLSVRRSWEHDQQLFVSYVRSSGRGELNDFGALFQALDAPLIQPGGMSRLASDTRDRVIVWGTFNLPRRTVISPVTEWRSGFPYSVLNERYFYATAPNNRVFPTFFSADMVVYKTFTVRRRSADIGVQLFNLTNHRNPRDVYAVTTAPRFGQFTNSVGAILRGYMLVKW
jgi:hypothetical protein